MIFTNNLANNASPSSSERPKPIDRRHEEAYSPAEYQAAFEAAVRKAIGNNGAPAATGSDPIRDMVMNALEVAGISTAGKSDSQMLAEYTDMLRKTAQAANTAAVNSQAAGEFSGYDLNQPAGNAAAAPVVVGNNKQAAGGEFAGYDLNKL